MSTEKDYTKGDKFGVLAKQLRLDPDNERIDLGDIELLAAQIKAQGVLNPISGYKQIEDGETLWYAVDGRRRYEAIQLLLLRGEADNLRIPFIMQPKGTNAEKSVINRWMMNEGKPFTVLEKAMSIGKLIKYGYQQTEIANELSISNAYVSKLYALYCAPKEMHNLIISKIISGTQAIEILEKKEEFTFLADYKEGKFIPQPEDGEQLVIDPSPEYVKEPTNTRITQKTLDSNKINSFKSFKKFASSPTLIRDQIPSGKREIYDFLLKILNNEVNELDFAKYFKED